MTLLCGDCGENKTADKFHKSDIRKTKPSVCKPCSNARLYAVRAKWSAERWAHEKKLARAPHRVAKLAAYRKTPRYLQTQQAGVERYRKAKPGIQRAHKAVNRALKSGKLVRPNHCEQCPSDTHLDAHHNDYNYPLKVVWLCRKCHSDWHVNNTPIYCEE